MRARLVGDVGGTRARFALWRDGAARHDGVVTLACADHTDLASAMQAFLAQVDAPTVREAAVAVATPLDGDTVRFTNNRWVFSRAATRAALGLDRLELLNDFTAVALGVQTLADTDWTAVGGGVARPRAPQGVVGPGTGLGVSGLLPAAQGWVVIEGEGGHATAAARTAREAAVLAALATDFDHVSFERVVSGPGLERLHDTLRALDARPAAPRSAAAIAQAAIDHADAYCDEAVDLFCGFLGTAASDLCVTLGARGGIWIAGGIVPALGTRFAQSPFRARFESKGRFATYVAAVPTRVITAGDIGLRGAFAHLQRTG
jgi:glucokinase